MTDHIVKQHLRESFRYIILLKEERLLENIERGLLFGYVQCDIEVPGNFRDNFSNCPPILKNINDGKDDIGLFLEK